MSLIGRTYTFTKTMIIPLLGILMIFSVTSCNNITEAEPSSVRNASKYGGGANGDILVYEDNPVILAGGNTYLRTPSWSKALEYNFTFSGYFLENTCGFKQPNLSNEITTGNTNCIEIYKNNQSDQIQKNNGSWNYTVDSDEFYQVNAFYHVDKMISKVTDSLEWAHGLSHGGNLTIPAAAKYNLANTLGFWLGSDGSAQTLKVYSKCEFTGTNINAFFNPALDEMCLGWNSNQSQLHMAQDPSVTYHELGHVYVKIMMNQRNTRDIGFGTLDSIGFKSDLGVMSYDEAGAINEGIADFFSYFMTGRKYIGEWAMDRIPYLILDSQGYVGTKYGRPMDEDDPAHTSGISGDIPGEKLSYPEYINYNPHLPNARYEGEIHYAGQVVSHYLTRLTDKFKQYCTAPSITNAYVTEAAESTHYRYASMTLMLINETLAEIGDMTAKGSDFFNEYAMGVGLNEVFFTNLNIDEAYLWGHQVTPPDMRRFFKIFAKNIHHHISSYACPGFTKDMSEDLLDEYGLLLFKSYQDAGQGVQISGSNVLDRTYANFDNTSLPYIGNSNPFISVTSSTQVDELNRQQTILVSKDYIDLPTDNRATAYVFDGRSEIEGILSSLAFEGNPISLSTDLAGVRYNNDNIKISPGEVVGVSLNLVNNSNSTMAGVQVLANDWDHMALENSSSQYVNRSENLGMAPYMNQIANWVPCQIDGWPLDTEGGVVWDENTPGSVGECGYTTKNNKQLDVTTSGGVSYPYYEQDAPQPICMVQYSDENETKWVSQDFFRKHVLGLEDHECLNNENSGPNFNPNECLVRMLPGANQSVFGRIEPQKTWLETISTNNPNPKHSASNITIMEVNKWIQPGTTFNCRFRVRFSNCSDCYNDSATNEDYKDYEYAGMKPFKVINFSFKVID